MTISSQKNRVRLYRFYNFHVSNFGQPFAICDKHKETYRVPDTCSMEKIGDKTDWNCLICNDLQSSEGKIDG